MSTNISHIEKFNKIKDLVIVQILNDCYSYLAYITFEIYISSGGGGQFLKESAATT